ncbi:MAG: heme peroxidase [Thelocarpon superellum]|nr:MAG: heme peroxidase [Thelocarpon superellum]
MATIARSFTRAAFRPSTAPSSGSQLTARRATRFSLPPPPARPFRRGYASGPAGQSSGSGIYWGLALVAAGGAGYYHFVVNEGKVPEFISGASAKNVVTTPKYEDFQKVYAAVAKKIEERDEYEDGSFGPVIVRLAWHASGTYDSATNTGGSNGATMRFAPEGDHGANAGLQVARDFLEPIKQQFPWISYSDLWILSGVAAIQEMHGPTIPWRPGRLDADVSLCTPDGRLPDASKEQSHLRAIFGRMGFDDREIVALSGAHALGRCHTDRSGYDGPWTFSPTILTNDYYKLLLDEKWQWKKWNGPKQYEDKTTKTLMMLPTDMALVKDSSFKKHVERYAKDNDAFFNEFRDVIVKLFELGVPFKSSESERMVFKPSHSS